MAEVFQYNFHTIRASTSRIRSLLKYLDWAKLVPF